MRKRHEIRDFDTLRGGSFANLNNTTSSMQTIYKSAEITNSTWNVVTTTASLTHDSPKNP